MSRVILILLSTVFLQSCSYILYPMIRNYTGETVTFVMEIKESDAYFYWNESYYKDINASQEKLLAANNELYKIELSDTVRYSLDSTRLYLTLPPRSTTRLNGFSHFFHEAPYHTEHLNIYIERANGTKQFLGTDIPMTAYGPSGKLKTDARPFSKDRVVFDIR